MSSTPGRGKNSEYLARDEGLNSRTVPFCSKTCPFHSLRNTMALPGSQVVSRLDPYCHCLTRSGTVSARQTLLAGAWMLTTDSVVFMGSPRGALAFRVAKLPGAGSVCKWPESGPTVEGSGSPVPFCCKSGTALPRRGLTPFHGLHECIRGREVAIRNLAEL